MWVRFGRWIELGVHFGRQNRSIEVLDGYTVHALSGLDSVSGTMALIVR